MIQHFSARIDSLVNSHFPGGQITARITTVDEAKVFLKQCDIAKKDLGLLKKEIALAKKEGKAEYAGDRANIQSSNARTGLFGKTLGGMMKKGNQNKRANLRQTELSHMAQFDGLLGQIDRTVLNIDKAKIQIQQWVAQQK